MPTPKSKISIKYGSQAEYDALPTKDTNTIYFITDKSRIYVGTTEYTRHINLFDSMPEGKVCLPESFFVVQPTETSLELYYSADGYSDSAILISEISIIDNPGTFGPGEDVDLDFGETFEIPYFTVNESGKITEAGSSQMKLPSSPNLSKETSGSGNALTDITVNGQTITIVKGKTFTEKSEFDSLDSKVTSLESQIAGKVSSVTGQEGTENGKFVLVVNGKSTAIPIHGLGSAAFSDSRDFATSAQGIRADNAISKYGGIMEGPLEVETPTDPSHAATKQYVDEHSGSTSGRIWKSTSVYSSSVPLISILPSGSSPSIDDLVWFSDRKVATVESTDGQVLQMSNEQFEVLTTEEKSQLLQQYYQIFEATVLTTDWDNDKLAHLQRPSTLEDNDFIILVPYYDSSLDFSNSQIRIVSVDNSLITIVCTNVPLNDVHMRLFCIREFTSSTVEVL